MNLVMPGLKDRRVVAKGGERSPRANQTQGEVGDNGESIISEVGSKDLSQNAQHISEVDTLALQLNQVKISDASTSDPLCDPAAHFVVSAKGDIYYTYDVSLAIDSGVCTSFSIAFECDAIAGGLSSTKSRLPGLSRDAIIAGRRLVSALSGSFPYLKCICCHDNLNALVDAGLLDRNAVQDLWVNIGVWAIAKLPFEGDRRACSPQKDVCDSGKRSEESWLLNGALLGG